MLFIIFSPLVFIIVLIYNYLILIKTQDIYNNQKLLSVKMRPIFAFIVAAILLKKGTRFSNVLVFIGAWSTTKIPLLLFEASAMGYKFMITRLVIDIFGILGIAYITEKLMSDEEKQLIYTKVQEEY